MPTKPTNPENKFSGWTDREILGLDQDRLKFVDYASVLAEIIEEADTPLTIGVFGAWGSGKTSLMRLIKDSLDKAGDKTKFKTLWFDAWTFDKEEALWRAVILLVLKELRKEIPESDEVSTKTLDDLQVSLYRDVDREEVGKLVVDWEKAGFIAAKKVANLSLSLVPGVGKLIADTIGKTTEKITGEKLDSVFDAVQRSRQRIHRDHVEGLEQFQQEFAELLDDYFLKKDRRLVVFVDDLDRCLPEKAISVLEAIKLFLDAPGCVYIVGTDRDVIEQGIRVKYKDFLVGESTKTPITGDQYLEKIIQLPFNLPPLQEERIEEYIKQYDQSVPDDCRTILAVGTEPNPRKVKRIINVFRLLRKLAEKRVTEKEIEEFTAGLLAKIVVIQSRWRDLYDDLREYPNLIQDLEQHFRAPETKAQSLEKAIAVAGDVVGREKVEMHVHAGEKKAKPAHRPRGTQEKEPQLPEDVTTAGGVVDQDQRISGSAEKVRQPTLLVDKYAGDKSLGQMLRLEPYFESLKIDQIQDYLYLTHTLVDEPEKKEEPVNVDQRRWDDFMSNDPTKVRAAAVAIQADQAKSYTPVLINVVSGKQAASTQQRVLAGDTLGILGDPRFQEDAWYLPDDPMLGFIEIPAGEFWMGSDPNRDSLAYKNEQPQHEVNLPAYLMARYPVTVAQFQAFVTANPYQPKIDSSLSGLPNHPVVYVTWHDALAYCNWLSSTLKTWKNIPPALAEKLAAHQWRITLPSEAEWEKAARGSDGRIYPYGNEFDADKANSDESGIRPTSAVGCFPNGASPYGLLDMSGNVEEWTRSLWGKHNSTPEFKYPYDPKDGRENLKAPYDIFRVVRGGSFLGNRRDARAANRSRNLHDLTLVSLGFRVVVTPALS